ncbi:DNA-binding response regulator, partial [Streptomyces sp. ND04-05B]|nr:DNA-binding response regulator [Streptomyces sp. ND04-05B]
MSDANGANDLAAGGSGTGPAGDRSGATARGTDAAEGVPDEPGRPDAPSTPTAAPHAGNPPGRPAGVESGPGRIADWGGRGGG